MLLNLPKKDYQTLNWIELDSQKVAHNLALVAHNNPGKAIFAVLKSNAYGHGLVEMTKILNKSDCDFIGVDGYFEAAQLRFISKHRLLVMGYIKPENFKMLDVRRCSFVVQDEAGLKAMAKLRDRVNVHLELNTGMNRLGLNPDEIEPYLSVIKESSNLNLEGVMTHLADADNEDDDGFTNMQVELFDRTVARILKLGFKPRYFHIAQTAGSAKVSSEYANAVRLGIGLYGLNPLRPNDKAYPKLSQLEPILDLKSTIIKCLELKKGDRVSYNGIFKASKAMRIAVLPLGYYEGVPRSLSNRGIFMFNGKEVAIVGRVCMNHTMIDISQTDAKVGDHVSIVSSRRSDPNSVEQMGNRFGPFFYEAVTGLSSSIRRIIV